MSSIRVLHDNLLIEMDKVEEKTSPGGIVLPQKGQKHPNTALVVGVGPGRRLDDGNFIPLDIKEGDRVVVSRFGGTEVHVDGDDYIVIPWGDVLGVVNQV